MDGGQERVGRRGDAEDGERKEVTLRVSPEPCQQQRHQGEGCAGNSGTGQRAGERRELRRNKEPRLSGSQRTACVQLLLCHTQTSPPSQGATHAGSTWRTYSWEEAPPPTSQHSASGADEYLLGPLPSPPLSVPLFRVGAA